ncbi:MAG: hypothetical protein AVDCRST_MAG35-408 [uncultured Quadrisphaera sp.]|uniref:ABC transporter, substrate-binding protein (Cluster 1, maltose/g3p/polyamine/iron) n=1 Tax=uncultured Quadrisphaera sp. TaxID=904978 RepID=A0A6J4NLI0_9ACTN|nr:MAG: hypothetical protein AVDCRST_MAG35-408 [uncultured Quadrisphaera sp.]
MSRPPRPSLRPTSQRRRSRPGVLGASLLVGALTLTGCGGGSSGGSDVPDDGSTLTMWVRSAGPDRLAQALVDAYNESHENQIELTVVPADNYQQVVGAAAGGDELPDLLAADVVYSPNYVEQGLLLDITERIEGLDFVDDLSTAQSEAASDADGNLYGAPFSIDSSFLVYNKDLYAAAGLDPEAPPRDFEELYAHAEAVRALGGDTYGYYWPGNCAGCNAFTVFPMLAAAGEPPVEAGEPVQLDGEAMGQVLELHQRMYANDIMSPASAQESGATWDDEFIAGTVGILPIGNFVFTELVDSGFEYGYAPIPAPDGSATSTFVGGDIVGITASSDHVEQAWDFIEWSLQEEAQVEVLAQAGFLPSRVDLADNEYSAQDPRVVAVIENLAGGYTPSALNYGEVFNTATGPWLTGLRDAVVNGQPVDQVLGTMQEDSAAVLDEQ